MNQRGFVGVIILIIIALTAVAGGGYFVYQKQKQNKIVAVVPQPQSTEPVSTTNEQPSQPQPTEPTNTAPAGIAVTTTKKVVVPTTKAVLLTFPDYLSACEKYKTTFKHPLTGDTLTKEILGIVGGKCVYIEQMPNNGQMECKYTEAERKVVAQSIKDVMAAASAEVNVEIGSGGQKTTYTIDGKVVASPLQAMLDSGVCVVSGYQR